MKFKVLGLIAASTLVIILIGVLSGQKTTTPAMPFSTPTALRLVTHTVTVAHELVVCEQEEKDRKNLGNGCMYTIGQVARDPNYLTGKVIHIVARTPEEKAILASAEAIKQVVATASQDINWCTSSGMKYHMTRKMCEGYIYGQNVDVQLYANSSRITVHLTTPTPEDVAIIKEASAMQTPAPPTDTATPDDKTTAIANAGQPQVTANGANCFSSGEIADKWVDDITSGDTTSAGDLMNDTDGFTIDSGTHGVVINSTWKSWHFVITSGPHQGETCWVPKGGELGVGNMGVLFHD